MPFDSRVFFSALVARPHALSAPMDFEGLVERSILSAFFDSDERSADGLGLLEDVNEDRSKLGNVNESFLFSSVFLIILLFLILDVCLFLIFYNIYTFIVCF